MPARRLPHSRRPVAVLIALLAVLATLFAPAAGAAADPYVDEGPRLTLPTDVTFVVGRSGDAYVIEADGELVPTIAVDTLPTGLRLEAHGDGSATISGTPTGPPGETEVVVHARSAAGWTSGVLTVTVQQGPGFGVAPPLVFAAGRYGSMQVHAAGYPAPGIGLDGDLPVGLTFLDHGDGSATIAGTPLSGPLSAPVTLTAVNVVSDVALVTTIEVVVTRAPSGYPLTTYPPHGGPRRVP